MCPIGSEGLPDGKVAEGKAIHFHLPPKVKKDRICNSSIRPYVVVALITEAKDKKVKQFLYRPRRSQEVETPKF